MTGYFSESVSGPKPRLETEIDEAAWGGIVSIIRSGVDRGVFGEDYPEACPDGQGTIGCDAWTLGLAVKAEHPDVRWPLYASPVPPTLAALDLIEFFHARASEPTPVGQYHDFQGHYHLKFNRRRGQEAFRKAVNSVFERTGLAYELGTDGRIKRLLPPVEHELIHRGLPPSGDSDLDKLVRQAESKFLDPDEDIRREALEKLWDAFERSKTVLDSNKRRGAEALIDAATDSAREAELIEAEMVELTKAGNDFRIRHHETPKQHVRGELVDYLFFRMYALLGQLIPALWQPET